MAEFEKGLTTHSFEDRMTFTMPENYIDWASIDAVSDADPSSKEYRDLMKRLKITGRLNSGNPGRMRKDDYWD